jgi:hypothetical protein
MHSPAPAVGQPGAELTADFPTESPSAPEGQQGAVVEGPAGWDQDPFATYPSPYSSGGPAQATAAAPAAIDPFAASDAFAAQQGPLARAAQQLSAPASPALAAPAAAAAADPFSAPDPFAPKPGPLARGAQQLSGPAMPAAAAAGGDPLAAAGQFASKPGPLERGAQQLPTTPPRAAAAADDPFAASVLPAVVGAVPPGSTLQQEELVWGTDSFQAAAPGAAVEAGAAAWAEDPFGGAAPVAPAAPMGFEWGGEPFVDAAAPPAAAAGVAGVAAAGAEDGGEWGHDGWSDFAEAASAALAAPRSATVASLGDAIGARVSEAGWGTGLAGWGGSEAQGQQQAAGLLPQADLEVPHLGDEPGHAAEGASGLSVGGGGGHSAAVEAIVAQMPDLSFMLSPQLIRP